MSRWRFILTDLNYLPVGEILNADGRQVSLPLNKIPTGSFQVQLNNPLVDSLTNCDGYIKGYRDDVLEIFGPIISAEEVGAGPQTTLSVNYAGVGWLFQKRLAAQNNTTGQAITTPTDRAVIAKQLVDLANLNDYMGVNTTAYPVSSGSSVTTLISPFKPLLDAINELALTADGFDWEIVPVDNFSSGALTGSTIGNFRADPVFGQYNANNVFEYGIGRSNVESYSKTTTREMQANSVFHIASSGTTDPGYPIVNSADGNSVVRWKLLEDVAQGDLTDITMRQSLADEHVRVRKNPRQILSFVPAVDPQQVGRVPDFRTDYLVGDKVRARARVFNSIRFDGIVRIWGVNFDIDSNGLERITLTLVDEG